MASRAKPPARKKAAKGKAVKGKPPMKGNVVDMKAAKAKRAAGKVPPGSNSGRPIMSEEMILRHSNALKKGLKAIAEAQKEVNQERGIYRAARKLAKKEGFNLKAFDINVALEAEDLGQVQQNYADAALYQKVTDSPLTQISMFDSLLPPEPEQEPAGVRGFKAGESGLVNRTDNPYSPGTEEFVDWETQWDAGQAALAQRTVGGSEATH